MLSVRPIGRLVARTCAGQRLLAAKAATGKAAASGGSAGAAEDVAEGAELDVAYLVEGQANPTVGKDADYPAWLWELTDAAQAEKNAEIADTPMETGAVSALPEEDQRKFWKRANRLKIKEENARRAK